VNLLFAEGSPAPVGGEDRDETAVMSLSVADIECDKLKHEATDQVNGGVL